MPEESHGLFHLGKKDEEPKEAPQEMPAPEHHGLLDVFKKEEPPPPPPPPPEEHHGLLDVFKKEEPPPPPPPPPEEHHGLLHLFEHENQAKAAEQKGKTAVAIATSEAPKGGLIARLFHRAPVTPEPTSPKRPMLFQHVSFRSALYIIGFILLLAGIFPGIIDSAYRFLVLAGGAICLIGGVLLTGDWHPLTGILGLRPVHVPTSTTGVATMLAEREAKTLVEKATDEEPKPPETLVKRIAPWHWPWGARASEAAQPTTDETAKKYKHVGLGGKILTGIMIAVLAHGAGLLVQQKYLPSTLSSFASFAHPAIILASIVLILWIVTAHIPTRRTHWLGPFGILRRVLIFFVVAAVAALVAGLLTNNQELGNGYGEIIGALAGILAVLF